MLIFTTNGYKCLFHKQHTAAAAMMTLCSLFLYHVHNRCRHRLLFVSIFFSLICSLAQVLCVYESVETWDTDDDASVQQPMCCERTKSESEKENRITLIQLITSYRTENNIFTLKIGIIKWQLSVIILYNVYGVFRKRFGRNIFIRLRTIYFISMLFL